MARLRVCQELLRATWMASIGCLLDGAATSQSVDDEGLSRGHELAGQLDDEAIETRLLAPSHPAMPEAPLDREQRRDVVAYTRSPAAD